MRDALILLAFCFWTYPKLLAQPAAASIDGVVVQAITGAPLRGVHVRLESDAAEEVYGAVSNDAGGFSIAGIRPETDFRFRVERAGFLLWPTTEQAPGGVIHRTFRKGEQVRGFRLEMAPRVTIAGRVVDENGEPVPKAAVMARRVPQRVPAHAGVGGYAQADDRGYFRLGVVPDKYYVVVFVQDDDPRHEIRTDGTASSPFVPTSYPNSTSIESATAVEARAGSEVTGIEIRMQHAPALHISGTVADIPANAHVWVVLESRDGRPGEQNPDPATGAFSFDHVPPGTYRLYARCRTEGMSSQAVDLKVANSNVDFVQLKLTRGLELAGSVVGLPHAAGGDRSVALFPVRSDFAYSYWRRIDADVAEDGSFHILGVEPGKYELEVSEMADDWFVKTIQLGSQEAIDGVIDIGDRAREAKLTVTVSQAGAEITGAIVNPRGEVLRREGSVYLSEEGKDFSPRHLRFVQTNADGRFAIRGVAPGTYRIYSSVYGITPMEPGADAMEVLKRRAANGETVEVHQGDHLVKNVMVEGAQ